MKTIAGLLCLLSVGASAAAPQEWYGTWVERSATPMTLVVEPAGRRHAVHVYMPPAFKPQVVMSFETRVRRQGRAVFVDGKPSERSDGDQTHRRSAHRQRVERSTARWPERRGRRCPPTARSCGSRTTTLSPSAARPQKPHSIGTRNHHESYRDRDSYTRRRLPGVAVPSRR